MKKNILLLSLCAALLPVFTTTAFATTGQDIFVKYPNTYFVETGTCSGDGVQKALDAGFKNVQSIELSPGYFSRASLRFKDQKNVRLWQGDSSKILGKVIQDIREPITFWLDGHCSGGDTARGESMTPLMKELALIGRHPIKTHTIMIDDVREFGTANFDHLRLKTVLKKLREINPRYTIVYEDGHVKNDVLVAYIAKKPQRTSKKK